MDKTQNQFQTSIVSMEKVKNYAFSIPTYQRPYVWGDEQLKKLLDDFYNAYSLDPSTPYYVSTFLTKEDGNSAELIDGQQRFTSLWLISFAISQICPTSKIVSFLKKDGELRLGFEIRVEVREFLESLLNEESTVKKVFDENYISDQPYIRNIAKALVFISGHLKQLLNKEEVEAFGNYIYENVKLVKNTTPANTDLNKLFSTINSAGVQLEQTDIVKANLLNIINDKIRYGKIWEACENMNNFFERNVRISFPKTDILKINFEKNIPFDPSIFFFENVNDESTSNASLFSIDDIDIKKLPTYEYPPKHYLTEKNRDSEEVYCRSIINFGQLLLHTYRIHLSKENLEDFEGTFHVSRLIEIFKEMEMRRNQDEIKRFFHRLWEVRYLFDKYVVKWITDSDTKEETLELMNFNRNQDGYYSRNKYEKNASMMLQSVLYFTGDYLRQYWLTSYLGYLMDNHKDINANSHVHREYLELMDNIFSTNNTLKDKELSWNILNKLPLPESKFNIEEYLNSNKGTGFKHYWFQKLEYILWKNWEFEKTEEFNRYRITSRNSVEHIYPQNPENLSQHPKLEEEYLHSFGNLVLLNVAQNSEYSNKSVNVKRSMFNEKRETYDTLKSYVIFNSDNEWNANSITQHKVGMIDKIKAHYATN